MRFNFTLGDIPSKHIPKLANTLQFRPKENHQDQELRIKASIKTLPTKLKGPGRLIRLFLHPRIDACDWHKGLNRCVTDVILHHIQIEVGIRLNSLISHSELLTEEQIDRVSRLRDLHALWLEPETFEKTFLISAHSVPWSYQANKCDACILSCIAGNMQTLLDMRCVVRSRATSKHVAKHGNPRLQVWVDAWIDAIVTHVRNVTGQPVPMEPQIEKNEQQAIQLKHLRSKIRSLKKKKIQNAGPHHEPRDNKLADTAQVSEADDGIFQDNGEEIVPTKQARRKEMGDVDEDGADADLSSVDAYTALMSSERLPSTSDPRMQYEHPYISDEPEPRCSADTVIHDDKFRGRVPQEPDIYVPPRQNWKKQAPAYPSATVQPRRPTAASRRESWESVIFDSNFVESGITHQPAIAFRQPWQQQQRPVRPASSRYTSEQPQLATRRSTLLGARPQPSPADAYIDVLPAFHNDDPSGDGYGNSCRQGSSSNIKSKRPITALRRNSSAISPKTCIPPRHSFNDAKGRDGDGPSDSTQEFLSFYDNLAQGLGSPHSHTESKANSCDHLASALDISQESRAAMVPEGLRTPKRYDGGQNAPDNASNGSRRRDERAQVYANSGSVRRKKHGEDHHSMKGNDNARESTFEESQADLRRHHRSSEDHLRHHRNEQEKQEPVIYHGNGRLSHLTRVGNEMAAKIEQEAMTQDRERQLRRDTRGKSVNDKNKPDNTPRRRTGNAAGRREDGSRSRPASVAAAANKTNPTNTESNATTWSAAYGDQLRRKEDVRWFYHAGRD